MNILFLSITTLILYAATSPAAAQNIQPVGKEIVPPFGYIGFCLRNAEDCQPSHDNQDKLRIDETKWHELNHVNDYVNKTIHPADDLALHNRAEWWSYPSKDRGDCEDYALLKRKLLMERGWPAHSLLLSVVKQWDGTGHTVLLVATQHGDYVLDNQNWEIILWKETSYQWVKRQSKHHPYVWVNLDAARQPGIPMVLSEPIPDGLDERSFPKITTLDHRS